MRSSISISPASTETEPSVNWAGATACSARVPNTAGRAPRRRPPAFRGGHRAATPRAAIRPMVSASAPAWPVSAARRGWLWTYTHRPRYPRRVRPRPTDGPSRNRARRGAADNAAVGTARSDQFLGHRKDAAGTKHRNALGARLALMLRVGGDDRRGSLAV